jgi:hypothetical protein
VLPRVKQRTVLSKCPAKSRSRWSRATSRVAPQRPGRVLEGGAAEIVRDVERADPQVVRSAMASPVAKRRGPTASFYTPHQARPSPIETGERIVLKRRLCGLRQCA